MELRMVNTGRPQATYGIQVAIFLTITPPTEPVQSLVVALESCSWETVLGAAVFLGLCQLRTS